MELNAYKYKSCIIGGAIGDAWGSAWENQPQSNPAGIFYWGTQPDDNREWFISDDTQLTLATCEALSENQFDAAVLAGKFLEYFQNKKITGIGASTLQAMTALEAGAHWAQAGRQGEFAAGNGAAMRIAPFAFYSATTKEHVFDACRITHKNDEAYAGALAVFLAVKAALRQEWTGSNSLIEIILPDLPDTRVKDRLLEIQNLPQECTIAEVARLGNSGFVVNSVPLAIFSATKIRSLGMEKMFHEVIAAGGDTDTNCSIAGQIAGTLIGYDNFPAQLLSKFQNLPEHNWILGVIAKTNPE